MSLTLTVSLTPGPHRLTRHGIDRVTRHGRLVLGGSKRRLDDGYAQRTSRDAPEVGLQVIMGSEAERIHTLAVDSGHHEAHPRAGFLAVRPDLRDGKGGVSG